MPVCANITAVVLADWCILLLCCSPADSHQRHGGYTGGSGGYGGGSYGGGGGGYGKHGNRVDTCHPAMHGAGFVQSFPLYVWVCSVSAILAVESSGAAGCVDHQSCCSSACSSAEHWALEQLRSWSSVCRCPCFALAAFAVEWLCGTAYHWLAVFSALIAVCCVPCRWRWLWWRWRL